MAILKGLAETQCYPLCDTLREMDRDRSRTRPALAATGRLMAEAYRQAVVKKIKPVFDLLQPRLNITFLNIPEDASIRKISALIMR